MLARMIVGKMFASLLELFGTLKASPYAMLGILVGVIMPVVSGWVFPAYQSQLATQWLEWTKLLEAPFLVCEFLVVTFAVHRGMEIGQFIRAMTLDIKVASTLLLVGIWFSSVFISAEPATSIALSLGTLLHILFAFSILYLAENNGRSQFDGFWLSMGMGLLVLCVYIAWRFLLPVPPSMVPGGKIEWGFAIPGFINVRYFGTWTGAIAMAFVAMVIQRGEKARVSWPDFYMFVAMAMTIWSGTRAAILGLIVATIAMLIAQRRMPSFATSGRLCIISGLAAITAWLLLPENAPEFMLFQFDELGHAGTFTTNGRTELWIATYDKWLEAPWFGWGSGSLFWEVFLGWRHTQPHNAFMQFLMSWGVIGATGACWLLGRAVYAAQQATNKNPELWPFMAMLFALLTMSMVDGALYYPRFVMMIMLCLAVMLSGIRFRNLEENTSGIIGDRDQRYRPA